MTAPADVYLEPIINSDVSLMGLYSATHNNNHVPSFSDSSGKRYLHQHKTSFLQGDRTGAPNSYDITII